MSVELEHQLWCDVRRILSGFLELDLETADPQDYPRLLARREEAEALLEMIGRR